MTNDEAREHLAKHPVHLDGCLDCLEVAMIHDEARRAAGRAPACSHSPPALGCPSCFDALRSAAAGLPEPRASDPPPAGYASWAAFAGNLAGEVEILRRENEVLRRRVDPPPVLAEEFEMAKEAKLAAAECGRAAASAAKRLAGDPAQEGSGRLIEAIRVASAAAQTLDRVGDKLLSR